MVIEKTMNKLLKFIVGYLSFLYSDYEAVISSTKIDKEHSSYNGVIYLKINDLIIKISLDRDQLFIDFKSTLHKKTDYFSHDLVWALITSKIKDELFNKEDVVFLHRYMDKILELFAENNYLNTEKKLKKLRKKRMKKIDECNFEVSPFNNINTFI
jgi:hypothetical protein